jgi:hypothetical protein
MRCDDNLQVARERIGVRFWLSGLFRLLLKKTKNRSL